MKKPHVTITIRVAPDQAAALAARAKANERSQSAEVRVALTQYLAK